MRDNRNCTRPASIFGGTVTDPVCEATKGAQNATYQVQSQACEAWRAAEKSENEWKRQQCVAVANACSAMLPLAESTRFAGARVLWVDDHQENNAYERQALVELGATITTLTDTDQAVVQLTRQGKVFDTIISDFARANDPKAGYTLLALLRKLADPPPLVIYSGSSTPNLTVEAIKRGAFGETNQPKELMNLVIRSVASHRQLGRQSVVPR
jgi:CheY-like chemotaxis protein